MLKILRNKRLQKIISVLLIINIIIGSFGLFTQQAEASDYEWISFESTGGNGIQSYRVYKDYIIQTGIHNTADDDSVHYVTKYYYMTKSQYALDDTFYCGSNASIPKEMLNMSILNEYVKGDIKTTEYKINRKEFIQVAAKLGVTGEFVYTNDGATVYLNNVFKIMQGNDTLDEYVWGYPAMMDAVNWSPATKNYLRGYYNFPYHLNNVAFNIKVQAVDTSGNVLVDNLMTAKKIYTEEVDYVLPEDKQTMVINGVTYNYKNSWKYDY
ncbi:MAG TPA: hypothetical protein VN258_13725, partial [Mobilitalea sp.]|nr:hypothetical protein [Mobilitalea sp.]